MSGSPASRRSAFLAVASVTPMAVPSGSRISKNNSERVEVGKNCCCTRPKACESRDEHQHGGGDDGLAPAQAQLDHAAQRAIDAGVVDRVGIVVRAVLGEIGQQLQTEIGREQHRDDPGGDQRKPDDPENAAGIFAGARFGEADRQEARGRHQRAGQHRERRRGPGEGRGARPVPALLHLHHHHLDGDDGVVDQQPERDDQRAERDAVKVDARRRT